MTATPTRVLLTGAAGFIGSHLTRLLVSEGHDVTAIVRRETDRWRIRDLETRVSIVEGDLRDLGALTEAIRASRPDLCIHLAWHGWSGRPTAEENISSLSVSLELLRLMSAIGCHRFVTVGTCFEYDLDADRLKETTPLRPHDLYGACKKSLFEVAQEFSRLTGVRVLTPRVFYSYGPHEDPRRLVPSIMLSLLKGEPARVTPGQQLRDYLHVEDVASAIWAATTSGLTGAVNIASGEPVTIATIAMRIGELLGKAHLLQLGALEYRPNEPMRILGDASRLREIGWVPRFALDAGLVQTLAWWQVHASVRHV